MSRKGESIFKRNDGRYEARYIKAYDKDGKAHYGYVYARSYSEVKKKRNLILQEVMTPPKPMRHTYSSVLFRSMLDQWLMAKKPFIKESSYGRYYYIVETQIKPSLGHLKKEKITENMINQFLLMKLSTLSHNTVYDIALVIKQTFRFFKMNIEVMTIHKDTGKGQIFYENEKTLLENHLEFLSIEEQLGVYFSLLLGLRQGEVCGLKWEDVDFKNEMIAIRRIVIRVKALEGKTKTKLILTNPKTKNSIRLLPIPKKMYELLYKNRKQDECFILTGTTRYMDPRTYYNHYQKLLKKIGLHHTYHDLRHTFATNCIELGMDAKTLMELLGHASINTTLAIYTHSSIKTKRTFLNQL